MIGIPLGLVVANASEWLIHKHVLHGQGRDRKSYWSFHLHEHHLASLRTRGRDPAYEKSPFGWHAQGKELLGLVALGVPVMALFPVAPFFAGTLVWSGVDYYRKHKKAHLDPEWARAHLPWHYDHHMGPDQEANWCVTRPWMDHVMGTRKPYVGTPAEARDQARRARVAEARRAALAAAADLPSAAATGASAHALDESRTSA
jgi:sterol desaturase/sphingolipid hydroxylase (fatty acid hydroxylase superfamily)